jgi:hypothetical protein
MEGGCKMNPLEPDEPAALVQFAITVLFGLLFLAVVLGYAH